MVGSSEIKIAALFSLHDLFSLLMECYEIKMSDKVHVFCEGRFDFRHFQQVFCERPFDV